MQIDSVEDEEKIDKSRNIILRRNKRWERIMYDERYVKEYKKMKQLKNMKKEDKEED